MPQKQEHQSIQKAQILIPIYLYHPEKVTSFLGPSISSTTIQGSGIPDPSGLPLAFKNEKWSTQVAGLVKRLPLAQVMILRSSNGALHWPPCSVGSLLLPLLLPLLMCSLLLSFSQINKLFIYLLLFFNKIFLKTTVLQNRIKYRYSCLYPFLCSCKETFFQDKDCDSTKNL